MTSQIKHHLTPDIMMAYSAGSLPEAFSLMVASHISLCDVCRAEVESYDALGGALLNDDTAVMSPHSLAATMALIKAGGSEPALPRATCDVLPKPLQDYVGGDLSSVKWRSVGMGVKQAILPTSKDASARLLFIPAGAAMPDHGHKGTEITMVLKGAFSDESERFGRGDLEFADEDLHHTPIADPSEDCICLAVTDAPLRFSGLFARIAQPFLKI
ncbi:MAG: ChrR family anti-sigma-E factor [Sedimentitalea sp.]